MTKAFVMLTADQVQTGELRLVGGALQQEVRLQHGGQCVCVLLVTYPQGSPEWERWHSTRTLDGQPSAGVVMHPSV